MGRKERKGKERKGKQMERKGKERKGKERKEDGSRKKDGVAAFGDKE